MNANVYFNNVSETLSIENEHYRLRINDHNQLRAQSVHEDHNLVDTLKLKVHGIAWHALSPKGSLL